MKKIILVCQMMFSAGLLMGQGAGQGSVLIHPMTMYVYDLQKYANIKGSALLLEDWTIGDVSMQKGTYKDLLLKFDVYNNVLVFEKDGKAYDFNEPVIEFILKPHLNDSGSYMKFVKGVTASNLKPDQFVRELTRGKLTLYRSDIKLVSESNEVNVGIVKYFNSSVRYYMQYNSEVQSVKLSGKDLLPLMQDKQSQIDSYIKSNKLNLKKEGDVIVVLSYYNSIQ